MSKTPVSILQEFCSRNMINPQYDLVVNGVGTHDPIFKYKLTVNEIVVFGTGKSKKEAKHDAAREALKLIPSCQSNSLFVTLEPEILDHVEDITSPYHGALKENAVGELVTLCSNNKLPDPVYKCVGEEGLAHARSFTFECHVAKLTETATSRTKKQAKHLSAKLMLQRLITMLGDKLVLSPPDPGEESKAETELNEKVKLAYANCKSSKVNENFDLLIKDYHTVDLTSMFGDNPSSVIKLANYNVDNPPVDAMSLLNELFEDVSVSCTIKQLPSVKPENFVFICELDSSPPFVVFGVDKNENEAKRQAAHKMISLLKTFSSGINQ